MCKLVNYNYMKHFKLAALLTLFSAVLFVGCKPDPNNGNNGSTLEATIKSIKIVNGGISGGDMINGEIDQTAKVINFAGVPAETNIAAVKFQGTYSLGAVLESDVIDFTAGNDDAAKTLKGSLKCVNKTESASKEETYEVVLNLKDPASAPVIEKIVVKDDKGAEYTLTATNIMDGLLCLGMPESSTATVVSVALSPARSTYSFTKADANGVISASEPGFFQMDFMGLTAEYEVTFASSPTPGADFSQAIVHDFSFVTNNIYPDLTEEFTRGGDFDGEYVLLANRTAPKLFRTSDLLNDDTSNPILLNLTGVEGGTHVISAGRLSHGHIYLCNLATAVGDIEGGAGPLKVYHYASPTAVPEVVLTWDGTGIANSADNYAGRIGDNISVNLDENGNGYIYFFKQEADNKFYRFAVTGFTNFSAPTELELPAVCNYYGMMNQVGDNQYLFTSSFVKMMWLFDADATVLRQFEWTSMPSGANINNGCDPRVIEFNRSRYLLLSNSRRYVKDGYPEEGLFVFDISEGQDITAAMVKMQERQDAEDEAEALEPCYTYLMTGSETFSAACVALCNAAEVDGKLLMWSAAPKVGMFLVEVPKMK